VALRRDARMALASASANAASQVAPRPRIQKRPPRSSPTKRRARGKLSATETAPAGPHLRLASAIAASAARWSRSSACSIAEKLASPRGWTPREESEARRFPGCLLSRHCGTQGGCSPFAQDLHQPRIRIGSEDVRGGARQGQREVPGAGADLADHRLAPHFEHAQHLVGLLPLVAAGVFEARDVRVEVFRIPEAAV